MNGKEMISHQIIIDDFMVLEWKISKQITPIELMAMVSKVNKLFKLSDVPIAEEQRQEQPQQQHDFNTRKKSKWTDEIRNHLIQLYNDGGTARVISKTLKSVYGNYFTEQHTTWQLAYLKKIGVIQKRGKKNVTESPQEVKVKTYRKSKVTPEASNMIKTMYQAGEQDIIILRDRVNKALNLSLGKKQVYHIIYYMIKIKGGQQNGQKQSSETKLQEPEASTSQA